MADLGVYGLSVDSNQSVGTTVYWPFDASAIDKMVKDWDARFAHGRYPYTLLRPADGPDTSKGCMTLKPINGILPQCPAGMWDLDSPDGTSAKSTAWSFRTCCPRKRNPGVVFNSIKDAHAYFSKEYLGEPAAYNEAAAREMGVTSGPVTKARTAGGTIYKFNRSKLSGQIPPAVAQAFDKALAMLGKDGGAQQIALRTAAAALRTSLATKYAELHGSGSDTRPEIVRFGLDKGGQALAGTAAAAAAAAAYSAVGTAVMAGTVATGVSGSLAATAIATLGPVLAGAAATGVGAIAAAVVIAAVAVIGGLMDTNCCDRGNCNWSWDYRFGPGYPGSDDVHVDPHVFDDFLLRLLRADWEVQANLAGGKCPGPDVGAWPLMLEAALEAWEKAHPFATAASLLVNATKYLPMIQTANIGAGSLFVDPVALAMSAVWAGAKLGAQDLIRVPTRTGPELQLGHIRPIRMGPSHSAPPLWGVTVVHLRPIKMKPRPSALPSPKRRYFFGATLAGVAAGALAGGPLGALGGAAVGGAVDLARAHHEKEGKWL